MNGAGSFTASGVIQSCIMLFGRIYVFMAQNIGNQVNITGFLVQCGSIGTAKFMRRNLFGCGNMAGIFPNQIFYSLYTDSPALGRVEERMLMSGQRDYSLPYGKIIFQSLPYFISEIDDHLIAAFAGYFNAVHMEIYILQIQSHTLRYPDPGSEKQRNNGDVALFGLFIIRFFLSGERVSALFHVIQKAGNLIRLEPYNGLLVEFRHIYQQSGVGLNQFVFIIIGGKGAQSGHFPFQTLFSVCDVPAIGIAAKGGASSVLGVDASELGVRQAEKNAALNRVTDRVKFLCADVFELLPELEKEGETFDVIILDPPAFTKSRNSVKNAVKGYREINLRAMKLVRDGGFLATCSCSHFMTYELFTKTINQAAHNVHRRLRQVEYRTQAPDHPILWAAEESYYLKFYIFQVCREK